MSRRRGSWVGWEGLEDVVPCFSAQRDQRTIRYRTKGEERYLPIVDHCEVIRSNKDSSVRESCNEKCQFRSRLHRAESFVQYVIGKRFVLRACHGSRMSGEQRRDARKWTNIVQEFRIDLLSIELWREKLERWIVVHWLVVESSRRHSSTGADEIREERERKRETDRIMREPSLSRTDDAYHRGEVR